eukprot:CAMPEP_0201935410 /NCGR_PEP_ID=MMETSP0903-20130614/35405_1 /ASSEMBLY_ACC=CAM_ASM_000552 /TAXON_ID=420261 /ORGANISM="Thalassiosira antarctica, Strain CCMP982" /LENGTH=89 /DNA_ID=CAMNT_0048475817 /DNA_START=13 /DNA_END=278 /DNA_ORIENTATION=-
MDGIETPLQGAHSGIIVPQSIIATPPHPTSPHSHHISAAADDDKYSDVDSQTSYVCQFNNQSCKWECVQMDYRQVVLQQVMDQYENKDG